MCKSLLLPNDFLEEAYEIRKKYLNTKDNLDISKSIYNAQKLNVKICEICHKNKSNEVHHLQYQKYANINNYIDTFHKNHTANLISICNECHDKIHKDNIQLKKKKTVSGETILL